MSAEEKDAFASQLPESTETGIFKFSFGKHQGRTLEQVRQRDPSYFTWIEQNDVHVKYPALQEAMKTAGLLVEGPRLQSPTLPGACPLRMPALTCAVCAPAGTASSTSGLAQPPVEADAATKAPNRSQ